MKNIFFNIRKIFYLVDESRKKIPLIIFSFVMISILELFSISIIIPYISFVLEGATNFPLFDKIINHYLINFSQNQLVIYIGVIIFLVYFLKSISTIGINFLIISYSAGVQADMKSYLIRKYLRMPYSIFLVNNSAEYINNTHNLTSTFTDNVLTPFLKLISELLVILFIGTGLIIISPSGMLLFISIILIPILVYDLFIKKKLKQYGIDIAIANKLLIKNVTESINGIKEIRTLKKESFFEKSVRENALVLANSNRYYQFFALIPKYLFELSLILFVILFISLSATYYRSDVNLITTIAVFGVAAMRLLPSLSYINASINSIRFGNFALKKLYEDIVKIHSIDIQFIENKNEINKSESKFHSLEIRNISFAYPYKNEIFTNLSFSINKGEFIGLLGKSGSGKTTFLNLLLGFLTANTGEVLINNKSTSKSISLLNMASYISQTNFIIDDTLRRNITLDREIKKDADYNIKQSLSLAKLDEFYNELPIGLETILGEGGLKISGGQRQRIALARTFYHKRDLIIMDEATNSLDKDTEIEILDQLNEIRGKSTIIMVSHDLETLKYCDKIYEIRDNNIFETKT